MNIDRRTALFAALAGGLAGPAGAQLTLPPTAAPTASVEVIELWPKGAPGGPATALTETVRERSANPATLTDRALLGIARPRMLVFRPARPGPASVMITPGGGYSWVVVDKEGFEMARWLNARGITAFVLFYRLPFEGWADRTNVPLADAQRAIRLIRSNAARLGLAPDRICAMGFSAGGHVCADLLARFDAAVYQPHDDADRLSARPDGAAPIYPVVSMSVPDAHMGSRSNLLGPEPTPALERAHSPHLNVQETSPPTFLLHAEDDPAVPVANTLLLHAALRAKGVATETHLFPDGGHGYGLRLAVGKSVENWPELFLAWGRYGGLFN
jgi:acetyl esterase/lipase